MRNTRPMFAVLASAALFACDSKPANQNASNSAARTPAQQSAGALAVAPTEIDPATVEPVETEGFVEALGVALPLPVGWTSVPPANSMRLAQVSVPDPSGDPAMESVIAISTAGGGVEGNITRWGGQVRQSDGSASVPQPKVMTTSGLRVTIVEFEGEYVGMGMNEPEADWMLRGAIIETPRGLLFVKMTGPVEPMRAAGPAFMHMMAAIEAGGSSTSGASS